MQCQPTSTNIPVHQKNNNKPQKFNSNPTTTNHHTDMYKYQENLPTNDMYEYQDNLPTMETTQKWRTTGLPQHTKHKHNKKTPTITPLTTNSRTNYNTSLTPKNKNQKYPQVVKQDINDFH
jgi:hypothetical protein